MLENYRNFFFFQQVLRLVQALVFTPYNSKKKYFSFIILRRNIILQMAKLLSNSCQYAFGENRRVFHRRKRRICAKYDVPIYHLIAQNKYQTLVCLFFGHVLQFQYSFQ